MPLPFLTADREPGAPAAAEPQAPPPPAEQLHLWRRPYRPGPWRVGGAALALLLASYLLMSALIIALADSLPGAAVCALGGLLIVGAALRLLRMGIWVSSRGLRQVMFFRTVTIPWGKVARVRTAQQPVKWLGLPRTVQGQTLLIQLSEGEGPLRPLLTDHNADFLSRPAAFNRAADTVETWTDEFRGSAADVN